MLWWEAYTCFVRWLHKMGPLFCVSIGKDVNIATYLRGPMICQCVVLWYFSSFFFYTPSSPSSEHIEESRNCLASFYRKFENTMCLALCQASLPHLIPSTRSRGKHFQLHFTDRKLRLRDIKKLISGHITSKSYSWDSDPYLTIKAIRPNMTDLH